MSSLIKRGKIWYYQWYERGRCHKKSLMTEDKTVAKQRAAVVDVKRLQGSFGINTGKITVSDCVVKFLEQKKATLKESTYKRYVGMSKNVMDWFGNTRARTLNTDMITAYINHRKEQEAAGKTIHEELNTLKAALKVAWADHLLSELPVRVWPTIKKTPVKPTTLGFYSVSDIAKLKEYFAGKKFEPIFLFALYTGCRRSEVAAARVEDVDMSTMTIKIRNVKTESDSDNTYRYISINAQLVTTLIRQIEEVKTGLLFPWFAQITDSQAAKIMSNACKATGVGYKRFHGLRHTMATFLIASGMSIRDVMGVMGWTEMSTAERYTHLANAMKNKMNIVPF